MTNVFLPLNSNTDPSNMAAQINRNFAKLDSEAVTKVYKGPTGKEAVINGELPNSLGSGLLMNDLDGTPVIYIATDVNGKPVVKIAKQGQNATTASDDGLIFDGTRNAFKISSSGTATVTNPNPWASMGRQTTTVAHGLNFTPAFQCYVSVPDFTDYFGAQATRPGLSSTPASIVINTNGGQLYAPARVDATNIYFDVINITNFSTDWPQRTWSFKYYLLSETAN